ncbi:hypothetical protein [Pseudonocardia sp. TMWB2A]|uniref:hypothetical protein n=1 Tax=Pseudonocardia sp. TMWB2A TaxID=687430 RepID=UPI00307D64B4
MKTVFQEDQYGCGTACAAMLIGKSYSFAARLVFPDRDFPKQRPISIDTKPLVQAVKEYRKEDHRARISTKRHLRDIEHDALLIGYLMGYDDEKERMHFMVWDPKQKCVRDPKGFERPCRITSYVAFK